MNIEQGCRSIVCIIQSQMDPLLLDQKYITQIIILMLFIRRSPPPEGTDLHRNTVNTAQCAPALQFDGAIGSVVLLKKSADGHHHSEELFFFH